MSALDHQDKLDYLMDVVLSFDVVCSSLSVVYQCSKSTYHEGNSRKLWLALRETLGKLWLLPFCLITVF